MNTIDTIIKVVSLATGLIGLTAIVIEQLSSHRRRHSKQMRDLQLVKIHYEIEKLIQEGNQPPERYEAVVSQYQKTDDRSTNAESPSQEAGPRLTTPDYLLMFFPAAITLLFSPFASFVAIYGNPVSFIDFILWFIMQSLLCFMIRPILLFTISSVLGRRIASLATGIAAFVGVAAIGIALHST